MSEFNIKHLAAGYGYIKEGDDEPSYTDEYIPKHFWTELGEVYLSMFDNKEEEFKLNLPPLIARLQHINPKSVLEVGCGFGRILPFVQQSFGGIEKLIGIEHSQTMLDNHSRYLKMFKDKIDPKYQMVLGDAKELPFEDNEFDVTYSHVCLTHIPAKDIPQVTSEIARVTKKWIVHLERFNFPYEHPSQHRWSHCLPECYPKDSWELWENVMINLKHKTCCVVFKQI